MEWAAAHGRLVVADTPDLARAGLLADWLCQALRKPDAAVMIAYHRVDVAALNHAARTLLRDHRALGPDLHITPGGLGIARGDRLLCLRNEPGLGVSNGTRGRVVGVTRDDVLLRIGRREHRRLPLAYVDAGDVAHAYAITGHKSQGQTFEHTFVLPPSRGELAEWGYVALTRARTRTQLYLAESDLVTETHAPVSGDVGAVDQLAVRLARGAHDRLASDRVPRPQRSWAHERSLSAGR
jgi:hypothetical protein